MFTLRQTEHGVGTLTEVIGDIAQHSFEARHWDGLRFAPSDDAFSHWTIAGEHSIKPTMGIGEELFVAKGWTHAVTPLDFIGIGNVLASELAGTGVQAENLGADPTPAPRVNKVLVNASIEIGDETGGISDE
jgi:hypothetical protein